MRLKEHDKLIRSLVGKGMTHREIAHEIGCDPRTLRAYCDKEDIPLPRRRRKPPKEYTCETCGKVFKDVVPRKFCSVECKARSQVKIHPTTKDTILKLNKQGWSLSEMANLLNLSRTSVWRVIDENRWKK